MASMLSKLWSSEISGPRSAARVLNAAIAILGIICIAVVSYNPAVGVVYYIILGATIIWSTLISFFIQNERTTIHPGAMVALDFLLAAVHFAFGAINAYSASGTIYGHANAVVGVFLIVTAVFHSLFFTLACRDTHHRRISPFSDTHKAGFEGHHV